MELVRLIMLVALVAAVGLSLVNMIARKGKINLYEKVSLAYGLGFGAITLWMLLMSLLSIKFGVAAIFAPWIPVLVAGAFFYFRRTSPGTAPIKGVPPRGKPLSSLRIFERFLIGGIIFNVIYTFFRALIKPLESYDAVAIYAIKSKIFYLSNSVSRDFLTNIAAAFPHPDYPLNIPLAETLSYIAMGSLNDQLVKIIFPLFYVAILALLYYAIRRFASRAYALLFTFIAATPAQFSAFAANGYLEVPLAYYSSAGLILLFMWFDERREFSFLALSALLTAMAAWTKNEGLLYCAISLALLAWFLASSGEKRIKYNAWYLLFYLGIIVFINVPWIMVKKIYGFVNTDVGGISLAPTDILKQISKIPVVLYGYQREFFGPKKWNIFWPVVFIVLAVHIRKAFTGVNKYVTASILLAIAGYTFIYITGKVEVKFFVVSTWSRFLIHFFPVAVYWLARILKDDVKI